MNILKRLPLAPPITVIHGDHSLLYGNRHQILNACYLPDISYVQSGQVISETSPVYAQV